MNIIFYLQGSMKSLTATEARKSLFQIIKEGQRVEIKHPMTPMIILPKQELEQMENELFRKQMEEALQKAKGQKRYTTEQVEAMLAEVLGEEGHG